ncbi:hypothetical protein UFOVP1043_67 [uncultured Caudovirales phage]|uniref:Uncharacterized protein n=1 Tax=uncultured Caudovirales phage TaxID=2100421 RepID=A0A6J5Q782_9CAUD|nr:hypothetical protein UFOVP1043_67 [uncultured Caudovirales phage]
MKSYRITQDITEVYYIDAESEDDALEELYSGEYEPRKIHDGDVTVVELSA